MRTRDFRPIRFLLLGLGLLAVATPAAAWDACKHRADRRASLDTTGIARVEINARAGDLEVRPAPGSTLLAQGVACASSEKFLEQTNVAVRREGSTLRVDVLVPDEMSRLRCVLRDARPDRERARVAARRRSPTRAATSSPPTCEVVKVTDSSGDIVLRRPRSDVEVWDSSGDTRIEDAAGRVQVRDSSGDIVIVGAKDVVIPSDSSGDISIQRIAGSVSIEQDSSGDIRVADVGHDFTLLGDSSGEVKVSGVKGEIRLP